MRMCAAFFVNCLFLSQFSLMLKSLVIGAMMMMMVVMMEAVGLLKEFEHTLHIAHFGLERRVVFD